MFMPPLEKLLAETEKFCTETCALLSRIWPDHPGRERYTEESRSQAAHALFIDGPLVGKFALPAHGHLMSYLFARAAKDENAKRHLEEFKEALRQQNADVPDQDIETSVAKAQKLLVLKPRFGWFHSLPSMFAGERSEPNKPEL